MTQEQLKKANSISRRKEELQGIITNYSMLVKGDKNCPISYNTVFYILSSESTFGISGEIKEDCVKALRRILIKYVKKLKEEVSNLEKELETI